MMQFGKLFLVPVPISESNVNQTIPLYNIEIIKSLKKFIVEDAKTARKFLKLFNFPKIEEAELMILNEHSKKNDLELLLNDLKNGHDVGLMSDAGCPGIADPGADLIKLAHEHLIEVVPLVGPSSIVLSIMASGFNGQNFAFVGYLPIDKLLKSKRLKELEELAYKKEQAQFFIETPYRNDRLFEDIITCLKPKTQVFVGKNIFSSKQLLFSKSVEEWRRVHNLDLHKVPVVFGIFKP